MPSCRVPARWVAPAHGSKSKSRYHVNVLGGSLFSPPAIMGMVWNAPVLRQVLCKCVLPCISRMTQRLGHLQV